MTFDQPRAKSKTVSVSAPIGADNPAGNMMHALQDILYPKTGLPRSLYLSGSSAPDTSHADNGKTYSLPKGKMLSANTYFNSFYLQYWREYTTIEKVGLELTYSGELRVLLIGLDESGNTIDLAAKDLPPADSGMSQTTIIWAWDKKTEPDLGFKPVRIYFEIKALDDSHLDQLRYVTDQAPVKEITLSIGLCSYNREDNLVITLAELTSFKEATPALKDIYIVNQGAPFANSKLINSASQPGVHLAEQGNFGGCGGFTRTMVDAVSAAQPATYHLLMDDDIVLDARVITRSLQFLSFAKTEVAIGGQMLELHRPTFLHEAGAKLNFFWLLMSIGKGKNLAKPESLSLFNDCIDIDYNAWWYCMIPTKAITKIDFSPPLFIHGDDIEYGCRLKKNGCPTVPLPGVGVWHESFTYKNTDWIQYYDLRNRLLNSVMHPEFSGQPDALYITGAIVHFILIHRYRAASVCIRAVEDFLAGPEQAFGKDPETAHQNLIDYSNSLPCPEIRKRSNPGELKLATPADFPTAVFPVLVLFVTSFLRLSFFSFKKRDPLFLHGWAHPKVVGTSPYYLANNTSGDEYLYLEPKRLQLWWTTWKAISVAVRYGLRRGSVSRNWRKKLPELQTREAWQKIFTPESKI